MKIVIQCAAKKAVSAGCMENKEGNPILFVADPELSPISNDILYARPDDIAENDMSWREMLLSYNQAPNNNPLNLYPAYRLYMNRYYGMLVDKYGVNNIYILSAGWGLIRADFLTPKYDITFSPSADKFKKRKAKDIYQDFNFLPDDSNEDLVLFCGKDYLKLFQILTRNYVGRKIIYYNSKNKPEVAGCDLIKFDTTTRTNWHYECVKAFIEGDIGD